MLSMLSYLFMGIGNRLGLGTVQFGLDYGISNNSGKPALDEVSSILDYASKAGIKLLDTAIAYGDAEEIVGRMNNGRFEAVSKFLPEIQEGSLEVQFNNSLCCLKLDSLYGLLAHRPLDLIRNPKVWEKALNLKIQGKVKKIGYSLNSPEEYVELISNGFYPDLVQLPYNYFDNRFDGILHELKSKGCETHVRSSFLQGLFFMNTEELPSFFDEVKHIIFDLQKTYTESLSSVLLNFVLENPNIDLVIVGCQNRDQLVNIFTSLDKSTRLMKLDNPINKKILQPSLWPL